jgi:acetamidase/formamidase
MDAPIHLRSTAAQVVWGQIPSDAPPVLRIRPGDAVRIDTVSHQGLMMQDPVEYFGAAGIARDEVLRDAADIWRTLRRPEGGGVHVLTGPIHVEGAQPGDLLEVRVLAIDFRVPYGVNSAGPGSGVLPELATAPAPRLVRLDIERRVALFAPGIELPLAPFMGIMAVAPPHAAGRVSTKPPGRHGGNLDLKVLGAGATLYLPVNVEGALFYTGDGHALQGDGEVNGTAIEISLAPLLGFHLHKGAGAGLRWPRAEDAGHWYVTGMDADLDVAMREAVAEAVRVLAERGRLAPVEAYALASLAVDFRVGEAVNQVQLVYGAIPKHIFGAPSRHRAP